MKILSRHLFFSQLLVIIFDWYTFHIIIYHHCDNGYHCPHLHLHHQCQQHHIQRLPPVSTYPGLNLYWFSYPPLLNLCQIFDNSIISMVYLLHQLLLGLLRRFLQEEISKKYRQAANKAAINAAITDLVTAKNVRHADRGKRLIKSSNSYKNVIASLQSAGVNITYDAMMKRVSRASVEDIITEIRLTNTSTESVVSSLSWTRSDVL